MRIWRVKSYVVEANQQFLETACNVFLRQQSAVEIRDEPWDQLTLWVVAIQSQHYRHLRDLVPVRSDVQLIQQCLAATKTWDISSRSICDLDLFWLLKSYPSYALHTCIAYCGTVGNLSTNSGRLAPLPKIYRVQFTESCSQTQTYYNIYDDKKQPLKKTVTSLYWTCNHVGGIHNFNQQKTSMWMLKILVQTMYFDWCITPHTTAYVSLL